jgi:pimeloyl-ACP methyl ester carboxylesterase
MKKLITKLSGTYLNTLAHIAPRVAGRHGFQLFCRPFRTPVNSKQRAFFSTAHQFIVEHEGLRLQGYKWGQGKTKVVFVHGWQSHSYRWKLYIDSLPKDTYTIFALDAPGHGLSSGNFLSLPLYADVLKKFIADIGEVDTAVGHSLGSVCLLYSVVTNPSLSVNRLALMAPPGEVTDFMDFFRTSLNLSSKTMKCIYEYFQQRYGVTPEYFSAPKFAASLNQTGIIIHDEEDNETPYHHAIRIHQAWKNSSLISTKGFGHNLKSHEVVEIIQRFVLHHSGDKISV